MNIKGLTKKELITRVNKQEELIIAYNKTLGLSLRGWRISLIFFNKSYPILKLLGWFQFVGGMLLGILIGGTL